MNGKLTLVVAALALSALTSVPAMAQQEHKKNAARVKRHEKPKPT